MMRRTGEPATTRAHARLFLQLTTLVPLISIFPHHAHALEDLWTVDIDHGPAPPPNEGPPLSANATRDPAILPYQIIGILGAYLFVALFLLTLLLTIGRKLRKQALSTSNTARPMEMVKPMGRAFDPSPISPMSSKSGRSWYSPRRLKNKGPRSDAGSVRSAGPDTVSPGMDSVVSFDQGVIEADRVRRAEEMERLYAAVMAQDERKSAAASGKAVSVTANEVPAIVAPVASEGKGSISPEKKARAPPRLITDAPNLRHLQVDPQQWSPRSPGTPKSPVRAIYPPDSPLPPMPSSPTGPLRAEYPTTPLSPQYRDQVDLHKLGEHETTYKHRSPSSASNQSLNSCTSPGGRKLRKGLRNLKISAPLLQQYDNDDGARTPLSPRTYTYPGIPPEPPTAHTLGSNYAPSTPGAASTKSWRHGDDCQSEQEYIDEIRRVPLAYPNRSGCYNYLNAPQAVTDAASVREDPTNTTRQNKQALRIDPVAATTSAPTAGLALRPAGSAANPRGTLPLRQMAMQQSQAQREAIDSRAPLSPMAWNSGYPLSAGPVKTTFLESRRDNLAPPRTGMATPYSPYMPFTPITPVTPHLTSRAERRQRERDERKLHAAIEEEDKVADESDMWGSGY
ncbi:hypothetical protein KC356_g7282 [Hortaea werneckii]|nr:hypothetical protein KC356_g7282 [Hortaea werneckii]